MKMEKSEKIRYRRERSHMGYIVAENKAEAMLLAELIQMSASYVNDDEKLHLVEQLRIYDMYCKLRDSIRIIPVESGMIIDGSLGG